MVFADLALRAAPLDDPLPNDSESNRIIEGLESHEAQYVHKTKQPGSCCASRAVLQCSGC
jgi:hypothetical protein